METRTFQSQPLAHDHSHLVRRLHPQELNRAEPIAQHEYKIDHTSPPPSQPRLPSPTSGPHCSRPPQAPASVLRPRHEELPYSLQLPLAVSRQWFTQGVGLGALWFFLSAVVKLRGCGGVCGMVGGGQEKGGSRVLGGSGGRETMGFCNGD